MSGLCYPKIYELLRPADLAPMYRAGCQCGWMSDKDRQAKTVAENDWRRHTIRRSGEGSHA